jgi:hypothetical protein
MNWMTVIVGVAACLIFGMLGLTAGINLNPASTVSYVWDWNTAGSWVSGIGALLAVLTTLWLADKQRREDVEHLQVSVNTALAHPDRPWFISIEVVADGKRPATVRGVTITSPHAKHAVYMTGFLSFSDQLPIQLSYGEKANFHLDYGTEDLIKGFVVDHCNGQPDGLKAVISTNLNSFTAPFHKNLLTLNS